ncbi:MAG TPA: hypothetical protein VK642_06240, partial [Burkholderiales bacterium]|nr:hypothetical protein [Burkholderiales bacterium]
MSESNKTVDWDDIQALLRFGFKHLTQASFLLLRIKHREAARAWLAAARVTSAVTSKILPRTALQVALTSEGLQVLGVAPEIIREFSHEFIVGMSADANRSMRLGDVADSAPQHWSWGAPNEAPHVLIMLYALPGELEAFQQSITAQLSMGFDEIKCLSTSELGSKEPFGFEDGISQPKLDWERERPVCDEEQHAYT